MSGNMLHLSTAGRIFWAAVLLQTRILPCFVEGLRCYQCTNAKQNSECRGIVTCSWGALGCENEIRMQNNQIFISKHCQQFNACKGNLKNNYGQCNPRTLLKAARSEVHIQKGTGSSLCRSCCNTDLCNSKPFTEDFVTKETKKGVNRHRMLLPPIADVESTLTSPTSALITFTDPSDSPGATYYITLMPSQGVTTRAVKRSDTSNVTFDGVVPRNVIAYIATGLSGGTQYRVSIIKKVGFVRIAQGVFDTFKTPPRPLKGIKIVEMFVDSLIINVGNRQRRRDKYDSIRVSYRKARDLSGKEKIFPKFSHPQIIRLSDLDPATEYNVSVWTSLDEPNGNAEMNSSKITITVSTRVPAVTETVLTEHHATNLTWMFEAHEGNYPKEFVVSVRDDTDGRFVTEKVLGENSRTFEATDLVPEHYYTFSIKVKSGSYHSAVVQHKPVRTVTRCYTCLRARSREQCMKITECEPEARGCLVLLRSRRYGGSIFSRRSFRATMRCKQVTACDKQEDQNLSDQCEPTPVRRVNSNPPEVCRCCCEGDLCDGPGTDCGRLLGWLDPLATQRLVAPVFVVVCKELEPPRQGDVTCTEGGTTLGTKCKFTCRSGTYLLGIAETECLPGGTWSHRIPQCRRAQSCPAIQSTFRMYAECTRHNRPFSSCRITCRPGYMRFGRSTLSCKPTGVWSAVRGRCVEIDECMPNPCVNDARCVDGINSFDCICKPGFYGELCERERLCNSLLSPRNGFLECTHGQRIGSRCRYACDPGFDMHGVKYTRCGEEGQWTGGDPTLCIIKICEVIPQTIANGGTSECTGFAHNDTCSFSCPTGLRLSRGTTSVTCEDDAEWSAELPCCDLPCPPYARVDLFLVLDSSSSVGRSSWKELVRFTTALLDRFVIGRRDMRVAVLRYNRKVDKNNEIELGIYKDAKDLKDKIRKIPYNGFGTKTGRALQHVYDHSIKAARNRPNAPDAVIVITDGLASDSVKPPADALKSTGAKIYVVGVINRRNIVNVRQLERMASGPEYLQIVDEGYDKLAEKLSKRLISDVCWVPCRYQNERRAAIERRRMEEAMRIAEGEKSYWEEFDNEEANGHMPKA